MLAHSSTAASHAELPPNARGYQPGAGEAQCQANLLDSIDLPLWANLPEARELLERILVERPERSRVLTQTMTGSTASYGFAGRTATLLRKIYEGFELDRMDWVAEAGFGTPLYAKRRDSLIAYERANGPDALIAKVLAA